MQFFILLEYFIELIFFAGFYQSIIFNVVLLTVLHFNAFFQPKVILITSVVNHKRDESASLITSVNSSWLISESISALDIIFSIVFNLLKAKKEFFYIYFYLFFKFILLYTFYLVCIFIIYIHSYLMSSFWFIPIKIYCVSPSLRVFGK